MDKALTGGAPVTQALADEIGAACHAEDGEQVNVDDVVFTWNALTDEETGSWVEGMDFVDSIEKIDDFTFVFHYNSLYPGYLLQQSMVNGEAIFPEHYCDAEQGYLYWDCNDEPLSNGPYLLEECTVFLKGCPLRCIWCHSPQSQGELQPRLAFYQNRCILCGACSSACPEGAHTISGESRHMFWEKCDHCGQCVEVCPSRALEMVGEWLTVNQVMEAVRRDSVYYENSGGGVTFSGGEPTAQPDFLAACAKQCREEGIHTALDTCGSIEWSVLERILPQIDLFLFDLKHMDSQKHKRLTGVNNVSILENLRRIDQQAKPIWIRIPLIPGYNDSEENLGRTAEMVQHLTSVKKISILPYNSAAGAKYHLIGRDYSLEGLDYSRDKEQEILRIFATKKIEVEIGRGF